MTPGEFEVIKFRQTTFIPSPGTFSFVETAVALLFLAVIDVNLGFFYSQNEALLTSPSSTKRFPQTDFLLSARQKHAITASKFQLNLITCETVSLGIETF